MCKGTCGTKCACKTGKGKCCKDKGQEIKVGGYEIPIDPSKSLKPIATSCCKER